MCGRSGGRGSWPTVSFAVASSQQKGSLMNVAFVYVNNECNVGRGAGYVAASVIRAGHSVTFYDTFFTPIETTADAIAQGSYDVLMVSTMTTLFPEALHLVSLVKERREIPVLLGGIHPTIVGGAILQEHPEIDFLCIGEGESMVADFLARFGRAGFQDIPNLAYRRDGQIRVNPPRPPEDLATLPPFPWYLFPERAVVQEGQGFLYVNATRGCPYRCTYCCNHVYLALYGSSYIRFRPVDDVIKELRFLQRQYAPRLLYFGDEMILSKAEYATALFETIKQKLGAPYGCMARVEYLTQDVVDLLERTGCQYMGVGVECGDEQFRKTFLGRRMSNEQIKQAVARVKAAGIFVTSFNMIGYPFDNDDELTESTVRFNQEIQPDFVQLSIFYPFPGTKLYERCKKLDLIDPEKQEGLKDYFEDTVLRSRSLKDKRNEIEKLLDPNGFQFTVGHRPKAATIDRSAEAQSPEKRRVLMLAPDHNIIDRRILQEAKTLADNEYAVTVISGFECPQEEHFARDGVYVHRYSYDLACRSTSASLGRQLPLPAGDARSRLRKLAAKLVRKVFRGTIPFVPRPDPFRSFIRDIAGRFRADIVHIHDLPLLWLGLELARQWQARLVYDAHEIYYVHHSIPAALKRKLKSEERELVAEVDVFITVNEAIAKHFSKLYGRKVLILHNAVDPPSDAGDEDSAHRLRTLAGLPRPSRVILYQGWFSSERNLESLVLSAGLLPDDTYLVMIGYGDHERKLRDLLQGKAFADKVRFLGQVQPDRLLSLTAGADLGVVPYQPVDLNHKYSSPNKFFEYVQMGVPVIAHRLPFFETMESRFGVVKTGDISTPRGMAKTINALLQSPDQLIRMREACRSAAAELSWRKESKKLLEAYRSLPDAPPAE